MRGGVFLVLFILCYHYLYDGINKRFLVYTLLSFLTGALFVIPRPRNWYVAIPAVGLYLLFVPYRMFQRIELPVSDMTTIQEGAKLANMFIIFFIYAVLLLLLQKVNLALGVGGILILALTVANYYVRIFRGVCLSLSDILAVGTAVSVLDSYDLTMSSELWYSILYFCFFIVLGFWCNLPFKGKKYHIGVTLSAAAYCVFFYCFWNVSDYLEKYQLHGVQYIPQSNQYLMGFLLSFAINIKETAVEKPAGYSDDMLLHIADLADSSYLIPEGVEAVQPNIIMIMNESWSDLGVLGSLETNEAVTPFWDSLQENAIKGNLYVNILGGLTANTEFEVLTGDSVAFLAAGVVPYQLQLNHDVYALPRVLEEQGYQTMAMHPNGPGAWNRGGAYDYLGFQEFIDIDKFQTEYQYVRTFISDECNYNEIIFQYEHRDVEKPWFLFDVTIQNHGDYYGGIDMPVSIEMLGHKTAMEAGDIYDEETYLNLIKLSDTAFEKLTDYFSAVEEPTIICMFGDHQPILNDNFYNSIFEGSGLTEEEQQARKYITNYCIWANYEVDFPEYGNISANYLGAAVLECAGVQLPPYYKYLLLLMRQYPEISYRTIETKGEDEAVKWYQMMQYNHLMEKASIKELFSVES